MSVVLADHVDVSPAAGGVRGELSVPGDKSIAHRALIFAGLGRGRARVRGLPDGADVASTLRCMQELGLQVQREGGDLVLEGAAGHLKEPERPLDCGNSGTTMRLLTGLLAGQDLFATLVGDDSLSRRPMLRVVEPLRAMGAALDGREGGQRAPLSLRGSPELRGTDWQNSSSSAQVRAALLLAGVQAQGQTRVFDPLPSRDHSERLLRAMGAEVRQQQESGVVTSVEAGRLELVDLDIPGDISSAAFLVVAVGLLGPHSCVPIVGVGLNPSRTGVLEVLRAMGSSVHHELYSDDSIEPFGVIQASPSSLRGVDIGGALIPRLIDELPILAVAAAFASGTTRIRDAGELRFKESDRIATTVAMLRAIGGTVEELPDGMEIEGSGGAPLEGGEVHAAGDHRVAMAAAVAALRTRRGVRIWGARCVETSFPSFFEIMGRFSG